MFSLKSLPQNIKHRPLNTIQTTHLLDLTQSRLKMQLNHLTRSSKCLHEKVNNTLESKFLGCKNVEKSIKAVTLIKLIDFVDKFVWHGKGRRCIIEPYHHMSQVILHLKQLFLHTFVRSLQLILLLLAIRQLTHQNLHLSLQFSQLPRIPVPHLV